MTPANTAITRVSPVVSVSVTAVLIAAWIGITSVNLPLTTGNRVIAVSNAPMTLDSLTLVGMTSRSPPQSPPPRRQRRHHTRYSSPESPQRNIHHPSWSVQRCWSPSQGETVSGHELAGAHAFLGHPLSGVYPFIGLDYWTGILDWITGLTFESKLHQKKNVLGVDGLTKSTTVSPI